MRYAAAITLLLCGSLLRAQVPSATLDTTTIRVGEQAVLLLTVDMPASALGMPIEWPVIGDTLQRWIEVVGSTGVDTMPGDAGDPGQPLHLVRKLRITSFDTGFWAIPPFRFTIGGTVMETAPLLLEVANVDLGENPELRDIKAIHELPFSLGRWLRTHWQWLAAPVLLALLLFWAMRTLRRLKEQGPTTPEPVRQGALHERILEELRVLGAERLWQNGRHKEYHSRITDILRGYIEQRYGVPALERTSDELLAALRVSAMSREHQTRLANMLHLSDMVKFAKALPAPAENERILQEAIAFVEATAPHATAHA
jgi:hypothetical protein